MERVRGFRDAIDAHKDKGIEYAIVGDAFSVENGYNQAILDANVVSMEENEYVISFNGEEHIYSSTIGKEVMDEASNDGYQQAIYDAELVESSDTGYILSFNGEENWYTFD